MKVKTYIVMFIYLLLLLTLSGCVVGHEDYKRYVDMDIGNNIEKHPPFDSSKAGKLIRSDYLLGGDGLTHITIVNDETLRYHYSFQEVSTNYSIKDYVGKCLIYYDVDPDTYIILAWGFDDGGNPQSCRTWP
jgi:hypothetical protein